MSGIGLAGLAASFVWPNCEPSPKWLRVLGVAAFMAVVAQGVLGGLRVTQLKDQLGIFHATLAQLFFVLMCAIALFQTDFWRRLPVQAETDRHRFRPLFIVTTGLILCQLDARRDHAPSARRACHPGFPGRLRQNLARHHPAADSRYNQNRMEVIGYNPITAFQVELQMVHRMMALVIFAAVGFARWRAWRYLGRAALADPLCRCFGSGLC